APKAATPIGNRPSPFGPKPGADKPASTPFGKAGDEDEASSDEPEVKPATPKFAASLGPRPNPFGGSASAAPKPAPKPSLATPPPNLEADEDEDDEPKYVSVDDAPVDDEPPSNGPRPTLTRQADLSPANMPRPANPVLPRPRPGGEAPKVAEPASEPA